MQCVLPLRLLSVATTTVVGCMCRLSLHSSCYNLPALTEVGGRRMAEKRSFSSRFDRNFGVCENCRLNNIVSEFYESLNRVRGLLAEGDGLYNNNGRTGILVILLNETAPR